MGFRILRGYSTEGRKYVHAALALPGVQASDIAHAHALYVGAVLADNQSDYAEAGRMLEACLELRRGIGNPFDIAATLSTLATVRLHEGDADRARAVRGGGARDLPPDSATGSARRSDWLTLARSACTSADDAKARDYFEQCLAIARAIDHRELEGECELLLGQISLRRGDLAGGARAIRALARSRKGRREQARRSDRPLVDRQGRHRERRPRKRAHKLGAALRAFQALRDECGGAGLPRGPRRLSAASLGIADEAVRIYAAAAAARERLVLRRAPAQRESAGKTPLRRHARRWATRRSTRRGPRGSTWQLDMAIRRALTPASAQRVTA